LHSCSWWRWKGIPGSIWYPWKEKDGSLSQERIDSVLQKSEQVERDSIEALREFIADIRQNDKECLCTGYFLAFP